MQEGLRRMYAENESVFYYLTLYNEAYPMPAMPEEDCREGILKGMYRLGGVDADGKSEVRPQLFGSGPFVGQVQKAQEILAHKYGVSTDLWSVTSYSELRRDARETTRWNALHPKETPRVSYVENVLDGLQGPFISASDYMSTVADQIRQWVPGAYYTLGTDGFGRSDTRKALRRHFEVDAAHIVLTTLGALADAGLFDRDQLPEVIRDLDIDPDKISAVNA